MRIYIDNIVHSSLNSANNPFLPSAANQTIGFYMKYITDLK